MRFPVAACLFLAALLLAPRTVLGNEVIASVAGEEIFRPDLARAGGGRAEMVALHALIWEKVARLYVAERGLAATAGEVAEILAYNREFERKDRSQRARKLDELNRRLTADGIPPEERRWLEEFRATLSRLARDDAERDRAPAPDQRAEAAYFESVLAAWKMNKALFEQYGGTVTWSAQGPRAHGAHAALIADYEGRGLVRFVDAGLRERLFAHLAEPPSRVLPPERVDFTPYWKLPIPPSYFPD